MLSASGRAVPWILVACKDRIVATSVLAAIGKVVTGSIYMQWAT